MNEEENDRVVSSGLELKRENSKAIIHFEGPFLSLPDTWSIDINLLSKEETDIEHVGEQLWIGSLLVAEYLLNMY